MPSQASGTETVSLDPKVTEHDAYRRSADHGVIAVSDHTSLDHVLRLAAMLLDVPMAMIFLRDGGHRSFASAGVIAPDEVEHIRALCHRAIRSGTPLTMPSIPGNPGISDVSGEPACSSIGFVTIAPMRDPTGNFSGALCAMDRRARQGREADLRALTELAAVAADEIALRAALRHRPAQDAPAPSAAEHAHDGSLEALLEATGTAALTFDGERRITWWNSAAARMFGYSGAEILGNSYDLILPDEGDFQLPAVRTGDGPGAISNGDARQRFARHRSGRIFWVEETLGKAGQGPSASATGVILRDITSRKAAEDQLRRSEARLAAAQRFAGLGAWDWDLSTGHVQLSDQMCDANKLPHGTEWPVASFLQLIHPDDRAHWRGVMARIKAGESVQEFTLRAGNQAAAIRHIRSIARLIRGQDGRPSHIVGVSRDITEQVQRDTDERQREKLSALGHLAGGVAHELNNLLLPINTLTSQIHEDFTTLPPDRLDRADTIESLNVIMDCGRQARDIVAKILLFARREQPAAGVSDLPAAVRDAAAFIQKLLPHSVALHLKIAPSLSGSARFIRGELIETLTNLAVNAVHAMEDNGTLTIALVRTIVDEGAIPGLTAGVYFMLSMTDTGCGMDEATQARIFEPFFTTKGVGKGTGLGLSAVHGIVRAWQGAITVDSMPGEGTTFRLFIPLAADGA